MQLLKHNTNNKYFLYTRWGRIGQKGKNKLEPCDKETGPKLFLRKIGDRKRHGYEEEINDEDSDKENVDSTNKQL